MNKILFALLSFLSFQTKAQTLHFLVFGDTEDTRIGIPTKVTCDYLKDLSSEISSNAQLQENYIKFTGQNFTKNNLQNTLKSLSVSQKDVIFVYIISHGWNNLKTEFPMMVFGPKSLGIDAGSVNLQEIHQELEKLKPRLLIVFGEACNREREVRPPARKGGSAVMPPRFEIDPEQFRNLFKRSTKSILLCSSKRGQVSTSDMDKGGWFTQSFREVFEEFTSKNHSGEATWDALLEKTKKMTEKISYDSGSDDPQSPFYEIKNISVSSLVSNTATTSSSNKPIPQKLSTQLSQPVPILTNAHINEPCKFEYTTYRVNEEKLRYLEQYWKGLSGISNDEASELFKSVYSSETKKFYNELSSRLKIEGFNAHITWFNKKGKEVTEIFDEANEYVDSKDFKLKAISKIPLVIESMKDITRRLDDIRRKCSE